MSNQNNNTRPTTHKNNGGYNQPVNPETQQFESQDITKPEAEKELGKDLSKNEYNELIKELGDFDEIEFEEEDEEDDFDFEEEDDVDTYMSKHANKNFDLTKPLYQQVQDLVERYEEVFLTDDIADVLADYYKKGQVSRWGGKVTLGTKFDYDIITLVAWNTLYKNCHMKTLDQSEFNELKNGVRKYGSMFDSDGRLKDPNARYVETYRGISGGSVRLLLDQYIGVQPHIGCLYSGGTNGECHGQNLYTSLQGSYSTRYAGAGSRGHFMKMITDTNNADIINFNTTSTSQLYVTLGQKGLENFKNKLISGVELIPSVK
jgi:hypothetical protein